MSDPHADEAVEFFRLVQEADSFNRVEGLEDLKFRFGDQWPVQLQNSRQLEARPIFTINETDSYCRQVINHIRQQRPRGKAHPVNSTSDPKIAEVITGIGRHIEVNSDADNAYDMAAEFAVTIGWGYWRVRNDYVRDQSFDQDIYVAQVENPFSVYFDPFSTLPDGSDAEQVLITDTMPKDTFKLLYPSAELGGAFREGAAGDTKQIDWVTKETIRLAEHIKIEKVKARLVMLSDGTPVWADELPPPEVLIAAGIEVKGDRQSWKRKVRWSKVTCFEELESKTLPGRYIPVVPVYGVNMIIDGKRRRMGMVRFARDPQMMVNYWQTSVTESLAMAPKAKWLMAEGQDEGFQNEWSQANNRAFPTLHYKVVDVEGKPAPPPERLQPEAPPAGVIEAAQIASQNLQRVIGMFDPVNLKHTGPKSGEAIQQELGQSENSNYHFYDNLTRSIKHTWRIFLDYTPEVYDTQRVMRVIGEDGKPDLVTINEKAVVEGVQRVLNDVTVGDYDVVMDTGPGFNTKRQESVQALTQILSAGGKFGEQVGQIAGDLIFRNMDFPGADVIADRLAAANPFAKIDDKSDVPPQAQMMIKNLQDQLQKAQALLQQASQEIKLKTGIEQGWMETELKKAHLTAEGKAHNVEAIARTKRHDVETRALTAQNVEELKGMVQLLLHHLETKQLHEMADREDAQLAAKSAQQEEPTFVQ